MPATETTKTGAPCWVDLMTSDIDRAKAFYGELFGWATRAADPRFGGYTNFENNGKLVAGVMPSMQAGMPDVWSIYLRVTDARATTKAALETGSAVIVEPMDVGELGTMAVVVDAGGAAIGMWQPGEHKGFEVYGEPGTPVWWELHTRDYDASIAWYQKVFGWTTRTESDTADFRYTTLVDGEMQWAGVMDSTKILPPDVPAHWAAYFGTADTDAALAKITALGGSAVMPAENTPYGRLAVATDPTGAMFRINGPNVES